jgi:preprotein translocase subunit Sss1
MDFTMDNIKNKINSPTLNSFSKIVMEYARVIIIILFIGYVIAVISIAVKSFDTFMSQPFAIIMLIMVPVIIISVMYFSIGEMSFSYKTIAVLSVLGVSAFIGFILYYFIATPPSTIISKTISYFSILVAFAIILVGLMIYYNVFTNNIKKQRGWAGFFINLLFYIPCLISDYILYLSSEIQGTPSIVFLLFVVEICLFLLYVYIPTIINAIYIPTGISILENPAYLTPENQLTTSTTFLIDSPISAPIISDISSNVNKIYNSNFSLSMWIFINNTILGTNEQESIIFKYANANGKDFYGKPSISYLGNDKWRFIFTNNPGNKPGTDLKTFPLPEYIVNMPSQKWHNVVFNYEDNKVNLYINGSLARTMDISSRLPIKNAEDVIIVGSNPPLNIPGAICNIKYHKTPLSSSQIARIYNILYKFNPPVNNLQ